MFVTVLLLIAVGTADFGASGQGRQEGQERQRRQTRPRPAPQDDVSLTSHSRDSLSPEAREIVERASTVVCRERLTDPKGSVPIDDMQGRPSLPVRSPEAIAGAQNAQRLLPTAKSLVIASLKNW